MKAKICLMGEFSVGKTSLTRRLVENKFDADYRASLGVSIHQLPFAFKDQSLNFTLWDLEGGLDVLPSLQPYFLGAQGAILVADLTRPETIEALPHYASLFRETAPAGELVVALNKIDIAERTPPDAARLARSLTLKGHDSIKFTSAATGESVVSLCQVLADPLIPALNS